MLTQLEDERWQALTDRTAASFIYGVLSTGIYCRPECPARLPRRDNVVFFDSTDAAVTAGFRACKRCAPDHGGLRAQQQQLVAQACRTIEASPETTDLNSLALDLAISPSHLHRLFRQLLGCTPKQYAQANRAERARAALQDGGSITEALYEAGFNSSGRFYSSSDKMLGMKPKRFRKGGVGEQLRFAVGECTFGSVLVAATTIGVCWVSLGEDPGDLLDDFQDRFHAAELLGANGEFETLVGKVLMTIDQQIPPTKLPLDIRGTSFQLQVWEALRTIPKGSTRSYSDVAQQLGQPTAVRAVATACASNQLAVLIPCHRVVRIDGSLSGYRWGVERKAKLLEAERELQLRSLAT